MTVAFRPTDWRGHTSAALQPKPRAHRTPGALAHVLDPATRDSLALRVIDRELVKTADHLVEAGGLMIFMSPQEGKSQRVSRRFPEWLLAHDPSLRIAIVSYEQESAVRWGRQILRDIRSAPPGVLNVQLMADSSAAGRWDTSQGGGVYCVGVGGSLTGRPVDVLAPLTSTDH
jgi:hypothetical protein